MHDPDEAVYFGKHQGRPWRSPEVNQSYLEFFVRFGAHCQYEIDRRAAEEEMKAEPALGYLKRIRRLLAQQFHPDKPGGSVREMQDLSQYFDFYQTAVKFYLECEAIEGTQEGS